MSVPSLKPGANGIPAATEVGSVGGPPFVFSDTDYMRVDPDYTPGGWTTRTLMVKYRCQGGVRPSKNQHMFDRVSGSLGGLTLRLNTADTIVALGYGSSGAAVFSSGGTGAGYLPGTTWWLFVTMTLGGAGVGSYQIRGWADGNTTATPNNSSGVGGVSATLAFNQELYVGRGTALGNPCDEIDVYDVRLYGIGLTGAQCGAIVGGGV